MGVAAYVSGDRIDMNFLFGRNKKVEPKPWDGTVKPWSDIKLGDVKMCLVPEKLDAPHTHLYQKIRSLHCDRNKESHACSGRIIIDRNGVTLSCPLCGDARSVYPKETIG